MSKACVSGACCPSHPPPAVTDHSVARVDLSSLEDMGPPMSRMNADLPRNHSSASICDICGRLPPCFPGIFLPFRPLFIRGEVAGSSQGPRSGEDGAQGPRS
jgi:hypothetical protein